VEDTKIMWTIYHIPSASWHQGDSNLQLYWAEHEARLECLRRGGGLEVWKPLRVVVRVKP